LYPDLINVLRKLDPNEKIKMISLMSRLVVLEDPGKIIPELQAKLNKRQIFYGLLTEHEVIPLTINKLIEILESISSLETEAINDCLSQEPK
jgi:hypothetical protein